MNFSGEEDHPNILPSTWPGVEQGTSGLRGRDLTTMHPPPCYLETCRHALVANVFNPIKIIYVWFQKYGSLSDLEAKTLQEAQRDIHYRRVTRIFRREPAVAIEGAKL